jgi:spermidine/putrescine transport system permease protein
MDTPAVRDPEMIRAQPPPPHARRRLSLAKHPWMGLLPVAGWQVAFYLVPLVLIVLTSFWVMKDFRLTVEWTIANYQRLAASPGVLRAFWTSITVSLTAVAISALIAYPLAYVIAFHVPRRFRLILLIALIAPFWTNYLVRAYAWQLILGTNGLLNYALLNLGLTAEPIRVLYTHTATRVGLVHLVTPLMTLMLYVTLENINPRLMDAASDLGAKGFRRFVHVVLPLSRPGLAVGLMLAFVLAFTDFISPAVLGGQTRRTVTQLVVDSIQWSVNYPRGAAISVLMIVVALVAVGIIGRLVAGGFSSLAAKR